MSHEVFISYSSKGKDKLIADAVCAELERNKIRCWIAPRDIPAGMSWGSAIINAIDNSRALILVFSNNANQSPQVLREVERAVSKEVTIIPFRIETFTPSKDMEYFLSATHWLDAVNPPLEKHIRKLAETVQLLLNREFSQTDDRSETGPVIPAVEKKNVIVSGKARRNLAVAVFIAFMVTAGIWWGIRQHQQSSMDKIHDPPGSSEQTMTGEEEDSIYISTLDRCVVNFNWLFNFSESATSIHGTYEGEMKQGLPHGYGTLTGSEANQSYTGEWKGGVPEGRGVLSFKAEDFSIEYEGELSNSAFHGRGTLTRRHANIVEVYDGQWEKGAAHGWGVHTCCNWSYEGEWENGLRHGKGTYQEGFKTIKGIWEDGFLIEEQR